MTRRRRQRRRQLGIRFRRGDTFAISDSEWMLSALQPVYFLTMENVRILKKKKYMVAPKADGQRALLLCEQRDVYLINPSPLSHSQLHGRYVGPRQQGFLIDAEVVMVGNTRWILAFDILSMEEGFDHHGTFYPAWDVPLRDRVPSLEVRHGILVSLVNNMKVQGLFVKPLRPAQEAPHVKNSLDSLPYKTDGLVFTPLGCDINLPTLKWKLPNKYTLDIAIGEPIERSPLTTRFIAYLNQDDYLNADETGLGPSPVMTASQVVPQGHRPFCMAYDLEPADLPFCRSTSLVIRCLTADEEYFTDLTPCNQHCPCKNSLFLKGRSMILSHCLVCSSLGISLPSSPFICQIACMNNSSCHSSHRCFFVDVPNDVAEWAKHGIVEVMNKGSFFLEFLRILHDKKLANSVSVANTILKTAIRSPILSSIRFKAGTMSYRPTATHYRLFNDDHSQSEFKNLRIHHLQIKGWLYRAFGGRKVIDACAGGLSDIQNWLDAGFTSVLAIDKDKGQIDTARSRLTDLVTALEASKLKVDLVEGDLTTPMIIDGGPFVAVFCHFAIHYCWNTADTIRIFISNLSSGLGKNGRIVITYLRGEILLREKSIKIFNQHGKLEFLTVVFESDSSIADVFVASIGVQHRESVMLLDEIISYFKEMLLRFLSRHLPTSCQVDTCCRRWSWKCQVFMLLQCLRSRSLKWKHRIRFSPSSSHPSKNMKFCPSWIFLTLSKDV